MAARIPNFVPAPVYEDEPRPPIGAKNYGVLGGLAGAVSDIAQTAIDRQENEAKAALIAKYTVAEEERAEARKIAAEGRKATREDEVYEKEKTDKRQDAETEHGRKVGLEEIAQGHRIDLVDERFKNQLAGTYIQRGFDEVDYRRGRKDKETDAQRQFDRDKEMRGLQHSQNLERDAAANAQGERLEAIKQHNRMIVEAYKNMTSDQKSKLPDQVKEQMKTYRSLLRKSEMGELSPEEQADMDSLRGSISPYLGFDTQPGPGRRQFTPLSPSQVEQAKNKYPDKTEAQIEEAMNRRGFTLYSP